MASRRPPNADTAAFRGAVVVLVGVLVGAVVLASMSGTPRASIASAVTSTTRPSTTVTTTIPVGHSPASVNVLVLNGVDPKHAIAKPAATKVAAAGFATLPPRDAAHTVTVSVVYFTAGYQVDAVTVAGVLSLPSAAVVPLLTPTPPEIGDPASAQVVVVIGPDAIPAG